MQSGRLVDDGTTHVLIQVRCFSMAPTTFGAPENMGFRVSYIVRPAPLFLLPYVPFDFASFAM